MVIAGQEIHAQLNVVTSPMGFAKLYERYYATVYRAALRITGNPADAEDILQTVFLRRIPAPISNVLGPVPIAGISQRGRSGDCESPGSPLVLHRRETRQPSEFVGEMRLIVKPARAE
jgi:hypothetical protein